MSILVDRPAAIVPPLAEWNKELTVSRKNTASHNQVIRSQSLKVCGLGHMVFPPFRKVDRLQRVGLLPGL